MAKVDKLAAWRAMGNTLACGRTMEEQIEAIRRYGNQGAIQVLRAGALAAQGIAKPKAKAENCVIFGCYRPFNTPFIVRDYIRLLDMLGIDYTYLDQEYCCGAPLAMQASAEQSDDVAAACREFNRLNSDMAQQKGATRLAYCCTGCAYAARDTFADSHDRYVYMPDLILDRLEKHKLGMPPAVIGYFEGCHTLVRSMAPAGSLAWGRYRQRLDSIEGLKIVDLPDNICCKKGPDRIIENAEKANLDTIVCPCSGCYASLREPAKGKARIMSLPELLLQGLKYKA